MESPWWLCCISTSAFAQHMWVSCVGGFCHKSAWLLKLSNEPTCSDLNAWLKLDLIPLSELNIQQRVQNTPVDWDEGKWEGRSGEWGWGQKAAAKTFCNHLELQFKFSIVSKLKTIFCKILNLHYFLWVAMKTIAFERVGSGVWQSGGYRKQTVFACKPSVDEVSVTQP